MNIITRVIYFFRRKRFVTLDGRDNSIVLSQSLRNHMQDFRYGEENTAFVFKVSGKNLYAFQLNPEGERYKDQQINHILLNVKKKIIGFESLQPTVNRILYDYGLPCDKKILLSINIIHKNGETYYVMMKR